MARRGRLVEPAARAGPRRRPRRRPRRAAPPRPPRRPRRGRSTRRASAPRCTQGLLGRAEVADAVVEDGDRCRRRLTAAHRVPLVEGTPPPSTRTASRRARATPLNEASRMWWVFLPVTRRTCRVMPAAVTKARQNSSASWGSKGGEPEPGRVGGEGRRRRRGRAGPRGRGPPRPAPRRAGGRSRRSGGRPALSPRASARHSPSTMPTSSTVWWASTWRSPVGPHRQVEAAVAAELLEHVVEEGQAGRRPPPPRCRRRSTVTSTVGLLGASRRRSAAPGPPVASAASLIGRSSRLRPRAARNRSFSAGVPTVTRRQPSRPGQLEQSRTRTDAVQQVPPHLDGRAAVGPEQDEVGVRRPGLHRPSPPGRPRSGPALRSRGPPGPPSRPT